MEVHFDLHHVVDWICVYILYNIIYYIMLIISLVGPLCSFKYNTNMQDYNTISDNINTELIHISEWLCVNKLSLNTSKTKYMLFHFAQCSISDIKLTVQIDSQPIQCACKFNVLGTIIQETLDWTPYIDIISNKISQTLGVMNKLKHFLQRYTLKKTM